MYDSKNPFQDEQHTTRTYSPQRDDYHYVASTRSGGSQKTSWLAVCLVTLLIIVLAGTCSFIAIDYGTRKSLAADCTEMSDDVRLMQSRLRQLMSDQKSVISLTEDQVQDKTTIQKLSDKLKDAKQLLRADEASCDMDQSAKTLAKAKDDVTTTYDKLDSVYENLDRALQEAKASYEAKELSDAKEALESTLDSAKAVVDKLQSSGNSSLASQFNAVINQAQQLQDSDNTSQIKLVRNSLEEAIDRVSDSLSSTAAEVNKIEDNIKAISNKLGADGTYKDSATQIIQAAGLTEVWGLNNMQGACNITSAQAQSWVGAFCTATPNKVYISDQRPAEEYRDVYFADAMRHEVAHYLINRRCGTTSPLVITRSGVDTEAVTSAYAVLYLGANDRTLNRANDTRYHMTNSAYSAAAKIHSGQCR